MIPFKEIEEKRNFLVTSLKKIGYEVLVPEDTFYMLFRVPGNLPSKDPDKEIAENFTVFSDWEFCNYLAKNHRVAALPGSCLYCFGYVRLSLTETFDRIQEAIPALEDAFNHFSKI